MALRTTAALYGGRASSVPIAISFRDYRGDATPKPVALASSQAIEPIVRIRRIDAGDFQALQEGFENSAPQGR
jgi:hypothetical protein